MRRSSLFSSFLACAALSAAPLVVLAPAEARAQTSASETARVTQLFKSGKAAFARNDMAEAERLFAEAFALRKSADIAANLGQSELEQQKYRPAAEHFHWALVNLLPSATDAQRRAVENGLARARAEVGVLRLDIQPEGSDVLVGEQHLGRTPIHGDVFVDPGEVIVSVKHDGYSSIDKRVIVGRGTEQAVEIALLPNADNSAASAPEPPTEHQTSAAAASTSGSDQARSRKSLAPALIATGVAIAGGAVGLVFTVSANNKESDADQLRDDLNLLGGCGAGGSAPAGDCAELSDQRKSVDSSRNIAIGAFVVGGVAALTAGYFYWDALAHRGTSDSARSRLRPHRNRSLASVALTPSLEMGRSASGNRAPDAFKLTLSGKF